MLDPAYHSRGITSFLLKHLMNEWAIPHLNARHIVATAFTDNIGSQRVMLKAGMKYLGTVQSDIDRRAKGREDASLRVYEWKRDGEV
jgi:RimJ/RimL family protein N-acetyltransferase